MKRLLCCCTFLFTVSFRLTLVTFSTGNERCHRAQQECRPELYQSRALTSSLRPCWRAYSWPCRRHMFRPSRPCLTACWLMVLGSSSSESDRPDRNRNERKRSHRFAHLSVSKGLFTVSIKLLSGKFYSKTQKDTNPIIFPSEYTYDFSRLDSPRFSAGGECRDMASVLRPIY